MYQNKYSNGFNSMFRGWYDIVGFAQATGLQAPKLSQVYQQFKDFCWQYILDAGLCESAMSECFEVWMKRPEQSYID